MAWKSLTAVDSAKVNFTARSPKVWPPLINSHSFMQTFTNQKSRMVSCWLLIGLNLYQRMWINQKRTDFWAPCFHLHILQEHQGYYTLLSGPTKKNTKVNRFRSNEEDKIMEKRLLTNYSSKTGHFRRQPNRGPDLVPRD